METVKATLLMVSLMISIPLSAQVSISVEVNPDTVKPGEAVEVIYTFENGEGHFNPPDMRGLPLVIGPNISSSFSIHNGSKSSRQSYSYIFVPQNEGTLRIPGSSYTEGDATQTIDSLTIIVSAGADQVHPDQPPTTRSMREKKKI